MITIIENTILHMLSSCLSLGDGSHFFGISPYSHPDIHGEVVFTTGMTGYPESLTDPSYKGQILVFTYPLIGNYGIPKEDSWESSKIHAAGVIVSEACTDWCHHTALQGLTQWLQEQNVPLLTGVDTRAITKLIRSSGTLPGILSSLPQKQIPNSPLFHPVPLVSQNAPSIHGSGPKKVIAVDCGMKSNILRMLTQYPLEVKKVPWNYDYTKEEWDGLFLSNGPGDPTQCVETIAVLQKAMQLKKPIFGICLGSQLMALAAGAKTFKLPFGHRGHNQPVMHDESGKCYITSQNHGYAVDPTSLSGSWYASFRNLNDQSIEGVAHRDLPYFSVQFHPEAAPGPTDTAWLFNTFYQLL